MPCLASRSRFFSFSLPYRRRTGRGGPPGALPPVRWILARGGFPPQASWLPGGDAGGVFPAPELHLRAVRCPHDPGLGALFGSTGVRGGHVDAGLAGRWSCRAVGARRTQGARAHALALAGMVAEGFPARRGFGSRCAAASCRRLRAISYPTTCFNASRDPAALSGWGNSCASWARSAPPPWAGNPRAANAPPPARRGCRYQRRERVPRLPRHRHVTA